MGKVTFATRLGNDKGDVSVKGTAAVLGTWSSSCKPTAVAIGTAGRLLEFLLVTQINQNVMFYFNLHLWVESAAPIERFQWDQAMYVSE